MELVIYLLIVVKVFILVNCVNVMIVNVIKNDFINYWCVNYDLGFGRVIIVYECDVSLNLRRYFLKKKMLLKLYYMYVNK